MSRRFGLPVVVVPHIPTRTCVGCGKKAEQPSLIRVVSDAHQVVVVDIHRNLAGRGAWMHRDESCLRSAFSSARLNRTLRSRISQADAALADALLLIDDDNRVHDREPGTE